jgi:drug/metabolite transporter (DMT)-like permease
MVGLKLFFKKPLSFNVVMGSLLGGAGIYLIFSREINAQNWNNQLSYGIWVSIVATLFASIGNMFAYKNHLRGVPVLVFNAYGMLYGTLCTFVISKIFTANLEIPLTTNFLAPLLYLAIFGTVIAFWAYQTIVGSMGADRAAYTSIISPLLAVITANFFENLSITPLMFMGILMCLAGNFISLKKV